MKFMILVKATKDSEAGVQPSEQMLKEMMKYDSQLRSMTGGRHSLQLVPGEFELVTGPREKMIG